MSAAPPVASPSLLGPSRWRTFFNSLRPSSFAFGTPPARFGRPRIDSLATEKQFPELPQLKSGLVCSQQIPCGAHRACARSEPTRDKESRARPGPRRRHLRSTGIQAPEHCTEHHSDRTRVAGSRWVVGAGQGVVADAAAQEDRHGPMMSVTPIDMEIIAAVVGLCFGARDRTQIVSTVARTDPAARSPATRQSTRCQPFSSSRRKADRFPPRERMDAEEQYQQRRHRRAATHPGQTDESADNKTGEWIEPVHDRYTSVLESGFRSFRSVACLSEVMGAFLRAERGHQRTGNAASAGQRWRPGHEL